MTFDLVIVAYRSTCAWSRQAEGILSQCALASNRQKGMIDDPHDVEW